MADIPYARWYSDGTVAYTKGSTAITGTNTFWLSAGIKAGDIFVDPNGKIYEITAVNDSTSITLGKSYAGDTGTGKGYSIIRNFNGTMSPTLAKRVSILLNEFEQRYDLDMQTVTPKSAYDIAKDNGFTGTSEEWLETLTAYGVAVKNGYTGTAEEWLESLKAAGEWSALDARTELLTIHNAGTHNALYRGKNLGTEITDEQRAAIRAGTFLDLYPGDYWIINGHVYRILHFDMHMFSDTRMGPTNVVLQLETGISSRWEPENEISVLPDVSGGFVGSPMYATVWPTLTERIITDLGEEHITTSADESGSLMLLSSSVSTESVIKGFVHVNGLQIGMPNPVNIFGHGALSTVGGITYRAWYTSPSLLIQYAYFKHSEFRANFRIDAFTKPTTSYAPCLIVNGPMIGHLYPHNYPANIQPIVIYKG